MSQSGILDVESSNPQIPTQITADISSAIPIANVLIVNGATVENGTYTKPLYTEGSAGNVVTTKIQLSTADAASDINKAGIAYYDPTQFSVNSSTGKVSLLGGGEAVDSLTGDDSVKVNPDVAGNINILGGPGVTTAGTTNTITINSVVYTDQTATTLTSDSGTYATAAGAYVMPASPANGELIEIVCITTGIIVTANTGQEIQVAGDVTTTAGTATNSAKGDSLVLRYRSTDTAWYSISTNGIWTLA